MAIDEPTLDLDLDPVDPGDTADGTPVGLPRALSPSGAGTFEQCPRRWRFRYVDRLPEPPGEAALVGTFAHRVLELLLAEPPEARTVERARTLARQAWPDTERHPDYRALGLDADGARAFRWKGWLAVEGLWQVEDPASVVVRATERRVRTELGGVPFLGVVDRLDECDDGLVVTDYKSGRPPSDRFAADKLGQVLLYAAAVGAVEGEAPVRARLVYLGARVLEVEASADGVAVEVDKLTRTWNALVTALADDHFEPRPGPLCGWCPHVARCPEGRVEVARRRDAGRLRADAPAAELVA